MPHTADEMWSHFTFVSKKRAAYRYAGNKRHSECKETEEKFDSFMKLRDDVLKALETARNERSSEIFGCQLDAVSE
ncbi:hypothetical protein PO124_01380 [Bacillus licheniformis]|nr:hypothetical protein [Bacillus licheniformis]